MKKALPLLMTAAAVLGITSTAAFASPFHDTQGHWAENAIDRWSSYGVVSGHGNGSFAPNASMSRAEMAQTYVNLLQLTEKADISQFTDVAPDAWYADAIAKCVAAGILSGTSDSTISPMSPVDREQMFVSFGRAMGLKPVENTDSSLSDLGDVSDWAEGMVNALLEEGYVNGLEDNTLRPQADINRASAMSLMDKTVAGYGNESGSVLEMNGQKGLVLVVTDDITVTGQVGDLVIAPGAADGTVTLKDATVTGTVTVSASESQLKITGETKVDNVVVNPEAQGAEVSVDKDAAVGSLTSQADQVVVSGQGKVDSAVVSGNNTQINTDGTKLEVTEGTTGTTQNGSNVEGGTTVDTGKPSEGGGSGGSGGSDSGSSHTHSYVDGVCEKDGSIDPSAAQVSSLEELMAALAEEKPLIVLTGSFTADAQISLPYAVTLNGNGNTITSNHDAPEAREAAGILISADGVTVSGLTVSGPNNTPGGWDSGEYAIKVYDCDGVKLKNITVKDANAGIQINSASVVMEGTITVSGNEWGGIEVAKSSQLEKVSSLDIRNANLVHASESYSNPVLWVDGNEAGGTVTGAEVLYTVAITESKTLYYVKNVIGEAILAAGDYTYDDYTYHGAFSADLDGKTVVISGSYTSEPAAADEGKAVMNDMARFLGALHRHDNGATIRAITFDGVQYTWNQDGDLAGSNWSSADGKTLVSAIVAKVLGGQQNVELTIEDLTLTFAYTVAAEA